MKDGDQDPPLQVRPSGGINLRATAVNTATATHRKVVSKSQSVPNASKYRHCDKERDNVWLYACTSPELHSPGI